MGPGVEIIYVMHLLNFHVYEYNICHYNKYLFTYLLTYLLHGRIFIAIGLALLSPLIIVLAMVI